MKIKLITAREILDSQGNPTVEAMVVLENGISAIASTPSGTSTGTHEALEVRDHDPNRYFGLGVLSAVNNIKEIIAPELIGQSVFEQEVLDKIMIDLDGTENKKKLGANSLLAVSIAVLKAAAKAKQLPLYRYISSVYQLKQDKLKIPIPIFNMFDGGKHGIGYLDFQEFHIIPSSSKTYTESLQLGEEIYKTIGQQLSYRKIVSSVGFEGGYTPNIFSNTNALEFIREAVTQSNYKEQKDFFLGLDVAASFFYTDDLYHLKDVAQPLTRESLIKFYQQLNADYRFLSLEDGLHEDDWEGWFFLTHQIKGNLMIVGDDLLCTNLSRLKKAIVEKVCNAILVKPNQCGTVSETIAVIKLAFQNNWKVIVSHRSGETNDDFIADLAVGVGADYAKFGAPARGERIAKYNRLSAIEREIL